MKKYCLVLTIAAAVPLTASPAFLQETEKPHTKQERGMMGGGMMQGGMMCPMMGSGGMGMMGGMVGGMMGDMGGGDPAVMGRMMQMRGEMMMKMGEVMMKYGKQMHKGEAK